MKNGSSSTTLRVTRGDACSLVVVGGASVVATWLSGLSFPEQNNVWHLPAVLDFFHSPEGPHDAYHETFDGFVSLFWRALQLVATERNVEALFVGLQLLGNATLSTALYTLMRCGGVRAYPATVVASLACFSYGLWGPTRLGYSEIFVTYATHTQFAIGVSLFAFAAVCRSRVVLAALMLGISAWLNIFIALWSGGALLVIVLLQRRCVLRSATVLTLGALAVAAPVIAWAILTRSKDAQPVPLAFYADFLGGHVLAHRYPQEFTQTLSLLLAACLASWVHLRHGVSSRSLVWVTWAGTATLIAAAVAPYLFPHVIVYLLHPLRFTSIPLLISVAVAGALAFSPAARRDPRLMLLALMALGGFMLKSSLVSVLGFALASALAPSRKVQVIAVIVWFAAWLATVVWTPVASTGGKAALASCWVAVFLMISVFQQWLMRVWSVRALAALCIAGLLATASVGPIPSQLQWWIQIASLISVGSLCVFWSRVKLPSHDVRLASGGGRLFWASPSIAVGVMLTPLIAMGLLRGHQAHFWVDASVEQKSFLAAQNWARHNTPADAVFMPVSVPQGFNLFSRRSVWWEQTQGAAVLWAPRFFKTYTCRREWLAQHEDTRALAAEISKQGVTHVVTRSGMRANWEGAGWRAVYMTPHYGLFAAPSGRIEPFGIRSRDC